jgi:hypothetical protein
MSIYVSKYSQRKDVEIHMTDDNKYHVPDEILEQAITSLLPYLGFYEIKAHIVVDGEYNELQLCTQFVDRNYQVSHLHLEVPTS